MKILLKILFALFLASSAWAYHDPETGTFLTRDPLGFEGGTTNLYEYCNSNPWTLFDPDGLRPISGYQELIASDQQALSYWGLAITQYNFVFQNYGQGTADSMMQSVYGTNFLGAQSQIQNYHSRVTSWNTLIDEIVETGAIADWATGATPGTTDPMSLDNEDAFYKSMRAIKHNPSSTITRQTMQGNYVKAGGEFTKQTVMALAIGRVFSWGGRLLGFGGKQTVYQAPKAGGSLYWHGSAAGVARRNASGILVDGPGNGGLYWTTLKQMDELGPLAWKVGGNTNVQLIPPRLISKGGLEATYNLTSAESAMFSRAWGPNFNWNPYQWWKGAAGQYFYRPGAALWGQRLGELGKAAGITGAGAGGGYLLYRATEE